MPSDTQSKLYHGEPETLKAFYNRYRKDIIYSAYSDEAVYKIAIETYLRHLHNSIERELFDMSTNETLYQEYYNQEKLMISQMNTEQWQEHHSKLSELAFKVKAMLQANVDHSREKAANMRAKQKEWLMPVGDSAEQGLVSDAINATVNRKKRMNKIEKMNELLAESVDDETRLRMIAELQRKGTESGIDSANFKPAKSKPIVNESKLKEVLEIVSEPESVIDLSNIKFED